MSDEREFWFNVRTGEVEEGHQSDGADLMGPYSTRVEAEGALVKAKENTENWDKADEEWDNG